MDKVANVLGSLFMLLIFVKMGGDVATTFYEGYTNHSGFSTLQLIVWFTLFLAFSVKTPIVPAHI